MKEAIWNRIGPLSGILYFGLLFTGASVHGFPASPRPSDTELAKWLATVDLNTFRLGTYIEALSGLMFIVFAAWLYSHLRQRGSGVTWPALVMLCAAVAVVVVNFPINAVTLGVLEQSRNGLDIRVAQTLVSITQAWFEASAVLDGLTLFAAGVAILRGAAMSRWAAWVAIGIGLLTFVPPTFLPIWFRMIGYLWYLAVAVYFTVRSARRPELATGPALPAVGTGLSGAR